jgi:Na+/proline symporter
VVGVAVVSADGGFSSIISNASVSGLTKPFYPFDPQIFSPDPRIRITLWSALIGTFTAFLARYSADQMVVQRYFTARTLDDAKRGFVLNAVFSILSLLCLAFLGFAIHAYAKSHGLPAAGGTKPISYIGWFVASLPGGACGLLVSGLFASTMSSIDSGIHSCCTAFVTDFGKKDVLDDSGNKSTLVRERILTFAIGTTVTVAACFVGKLGSIFEIANKLINGIGSPLLALVLIGMYGKRFTSRGVLAGGIAGVAWSMATSLFVRHLALHYYAVINLLGTLFLCWIFSLLDSKGNDEKV